MSMCVKRWLQFAHPHCKEKGSRRPPWSAPLRLSSSHLSSCTWRCSKSRGCTQDKSVWNQVCHKCSRNHPHPAGQQLLVSRCTLSSLLLENTPCLLREDVGGGGERWGSGFDMDGASKVGAGLWEVFIILVRFCVKLPFLLPVRYLWT